MINRIADKLLWLTGTGIVAAGVVLNSMLAAQSASVRFTGFILLVVTAIFVLAQTNYGKSAIVFVRDAKAELNKVVWPTKQETMQATLIVAGMAIIMALLLWLVDTVLLQLMAWLTGQGV